MFMSLECGKEGLKPDLAGGAEAMGVSKWRRWGSGLLAVAWVAGLAGPMALPFFVKQVRLDENALLPHLSDPEHTGDARAFARFAAEYRDSSGVEGLRRALDDQGLPYLVTGSGDDLNAISQDGNPRCDLTTTLLGARRNPQHQTTAWVSTRARPSKPLPG